jgi:hypothetical protein
VALVVPFILAACGTDGKAVPVEEEGGHLPGTWSYGTVELPDGRELECITMERGAGNTTWGGPSCNWAEAERGYR